MREWVTIHKIKALFDESRGISIRAISEDLGIARNTVRKYLRMDKEKVSRQRADTNRHNTGRCDG